MAASSYSLLAESPAVRDTLRALGTLAGMAVKFCAAAPQPDLTSIQAGVVPLCRLILEDPKGAASCRRFMTRLQRHFESEVASGECQAAPPVRLAAKAKPGPVRALGVSHSAVCARTCFTGLMHLAAPVIGHGRLAGVLMCGEFFRNKLAPHEVEQHLKRLSARGIRLDRERARKAYDEIPIAGPERLRAVRQLLADLAEHLGEMASHCLLPRRVGDPPCVACAKELVAKPLGESLTTRSAARAAHVTEPYFCRKFKETTGMTFSEYLARCHVERARELLHNPNLRVTDVAFSAGFRSIPHFNHTFKRYTGLSPNGYRASLRKA
jgi:AraC-like DNA-binding protein